MMIWKEVFNRIHRFNRISARYDSIVVPLFLMLENYGCNNCIWHQTDCWDTKNYFHPYDSLIRINYARINILRYASIILVVWARKHDLSHCRIDRLAPCYLERLGTIFSSSGCWRGPITSFIFFGIVSMEVKLLISSWFDLPRESENSRRTWLLDISREEESRVKNPRTSWPSVISRYRVFSDGFARTLMTCLPFKDFNAPERVSGSLLSSLKLRRVVRLSYSRPALSS